MSFGKAASESTLATWGPAGVLAEIIALYVFVIKMLFARRRLSLLIGITEDLPPYIPSTLQWDDESCFVKGKGLNEGVRLSRVGSPQRGVFFRVHITDKVLSKITDDETLEIELKDRKGVCWRVENFSVFENLRYAVPHDRDYALKIYPDRPEPGAGKIEVVDEGGS